MPRFFLWTNIGSFWWPASGKLSEFSENDVFGNFVVLSSIAKKNLVRELREN